MKTTGKSNSSFRQPKQVLVFNHTRILVAITRSMQSTADLMHVPIKAVSRACQGTYIGTAGLYFRKLHPDILIETSDLDTLHLEEYDALCEEQRRYLPKDKMKILREEFEARHSPKNDTGDQ